MAEKDKTSGSRGLTETGIIDSVFKPLAAGTPGALGLTDDAALLAGTTGYDAVLTADMLVEGVHFLPAADAADVGYKALAVNISDLAAKGADPVGYLLTIALAGPPDASWLERLRQGLEEAQGEFDCPLFGGDTVAAPGPVTLSITALGRVPKGQMVKRSGAVPGDRLYVTGTIGDGVLGLHVARDTAAAKAMGLSDEQAAYLRGRYDRPQLRTALVSTLREYASGALDVSDGLAGDFAKLCAASDVGGSIRLADVPLSPAARAAAEADISLLQEAITGGDDYEILATVAEANCKPFEEAAKEADVPVTAIGEIAEAHAGVSVLGPDGTPVRLQHAAFEHFTRRG